MTARFAVSLVNCSIIHGIIIMPFTKAPFNLNCNISRKQIVWVTVINICSTL